MQSNVMKRLLTLSQALDTIHMHMSNLTELHDNGISHNTNHLRKKRETVNHIENVIQVL